MPARAARSPTRTAAPGGAGPQPGGVRPAGPGHQRRPAGRREGGPAHHVSTAGGDPAGTPAGRATSGGDHLCSPGAARARCLRRSSPTGRRRPAASSTSRRRVRAGQRVPSSCGTTATRSTVPQRRAGRARGAARGASGGHQQRALRHPDPRRLATALAAVRARRSLDELDGWLPAASAPTCGRGPSRPGGSPAIPGWSSGGGAGPRECAFDLRLVARTCRRSRVPTGSTRWRSCAAGGGGATAATGTVPRAGAGHRRARGIRARPYAQIDHELDSSSSSGSPATS
jgi:hypothetical protein